MLRFLGLQTAGGNYEELQERKSVNIVPTRRAPFLAVTRTLPCNSHVDDVHPGGIISCESYECADGYTNVDRDCSTVFDYTGGRRLQSLDDFDFYTTDGYTTLGNYPMCLHHVCCESGEFCLHLAFVTSLCLP